MNQTQTTKEPLLGSQDPCYEEDEINLLDLFIVLLKHKKLIFLTVFVTGVLAVVISLFMPNIYRSEATLGLRTEEKGGAMDALSGLGGLGGMVSSQLGLGGNEGLEKLKVTLNSRELSRRVVEKHNLMPILFEDKWDPEKKEWLDKEEAPTIQDAWKMILNDLLKITDKKDSGTLVVGFEHEDRELSKKVVDHYIQELSTSLREEVLSDAGEKKKFFSQQLETITDSLLREKIYALMAKEIERETFAKAQQYYGFLLIDPPVVPDKDKKVSPKRAMICILSVFVAFFFSVFMAFILEFVQRIQQEDPERYQSILKEIPFWKANQRPDRKID